MIDSSYQSSLMRSNRADKVFVIWSVASQEVTSPTSFNNPTRPGKRLQFATWKMDHLVRWFTY